MKIYASEIILGVPQCMVIYLIQFKSAFCLPDRCPLLKFHPPQVALVDGKPSLF